MNRYLAELFGLENKKAAVIGGGGFLCGTMARGLAKAGVSVAILDKNETTRKKVVEEIRQEGGTAIDLPLDATNKSSHEQALQSILKQFGDVDILINGAGTNAPTPFFEIAEEEWIAIINSHATATFLGCQVFGKHMVSQKKGSIINMSSASSGPPLSKAFSYSVAKAGVKNLTQNLAREWGTMNVRVNALRPGFFPTEWSMKNFITPEREQAILGHTPMKRYGKPSELLGGVLWLVSDAASFVTGAEIEVDGGFSCMTI